MGLIVGVMLGGVGIVPIGILASAFNAVWPQVGDLALGLVLTFGARTIAILLAQRMDRDEAGISVNSPPKYTAPIIRSPIPYAKEKWRALVRFDRIQSQQVIMTALYVLVVGGLAVHEALHPSRSNYDYLQLVANLNAHPIASVFEALLPAVIFFPLVYWMFGWILRRNAARFKICGHSAETIKAAAKVCRYCGRDVVPARQAEVEAWQGVEDEQRGLGADANRLEPVQVASAADVISATDQAQPRNPRQLSRPALVALCLFGLYFVGPVSVWLANTQRTPVPPDIPSFDELLSTPIKGGPYEDAAAAYNRGDYATALRLFRPLANQADALAQFYVGWMYANGQGVPKNDAEAARWYRLAADQDLASSQYYLGLLCGNGRGVPQDDKAAVSWYRKAAEQGHGDAQFNLGVMYAQGRGVPRNDAEAVRWYRLAADQANSLSQTSLGLMYYEGRGVQQNDTEAVKWWWKSCGPRRRPSPV